MLRWDASALAYSVEPGPPPKRIQHMRSGWACLAVVLSFAVAGCVPKSEEPEAAHGPVKLAAGADVQVLLLKPLEAGTAKEGEAVPFVVARDVPGEGGVAAIRAGAPAEGSVTWSRSEGTLSGLANRPARLAVKVDRVQAVDGTWIDLTMRDEAHQFTRANTGRRAALDVVEELATDPNQRETLEKLARLFEDPDSIDLNSPEGRRMLDVLAERLDLPQTRQLVAQDEVRRAQGLVERIRAGGSAAAILGGSTLATVAAVGELAQLADDVGSRLGRMLRGRTIKAHVGTPVTAQVAEDVLVRPASSRP